MIAQNSIHTLLPRALEHINAPSFDGDLDLETPPVPVSAKAAVLCLVNTLDAPHIVLTKRNALMRKHAGQVSFPGGRIDDTDADAWAAARREAEEEIGLPQSHHLQQIGQLPHHQTITGFEVTPFVAINEHPFVMRPEPKEVETIFTLPIDQLRPDNFRIDGHDYQGIRRSYYAMDYDGFYIWGATARMLYALAVGLDHARA